MKILSRLLGLFGYAKRSGVSNPAQWLIDWIGGGPTSAGVTVTEQSALKYTPFWAAVRIISGTLASLPFLVYQREGEGKKRTRDHAAFALLHDRPNQYMDAQTFIETRQAHVLTYGNGYAEIQRNGRGIPVALWPLLPNKTQRKVSDGGIPYYEINLDAGGFVNLPDYNVLHIKGLGFDGYTGYDVVNYHKEAIGYGVAVKEYGARFFSNDASPGGVLKHPKTLSEQAAKNLAASWNAESAGLSKKHRMKVLEEGMEWVKVGVDPEQAQALEVQKYTVDDCSRIFNIPPHKLGSMDRATFSNIEEQNLDFVVMTMFYWFRKWEQECNYKLFLPSERSQLFCEILVDGLLRGNIKSRYEAYNIGRNAGFLSVNDIRIKENMNPIGPEGDIYLEPLNMKEAGTETPAPEPKALPEEVQEAHLNLLAAAFERVLTKHNRSNGKYEGFSSFALKVLPDPVRACASLMGKTDADADVILRRSIDEIETRAEQANPLELAQMLLNRLGGNNDAIRK